MATTQNGNGNKGTNEQIANDTLKTMEATGNAPKAPSNEEKLDKRFLQVSEQSCITSLEKAHGFSKSALHLEAAVSLALFCFSNGGADRETKRYAMDLYGKAGYDANPNGEDYKTINRRVNAFASLFDHQGRDMFMEAMEGQTEEQAIEALKNFITQEFNFKGINDILAAAGKPVKQYAVAASKAAASQPAQEPAPAKGEDGTAKQAEAAPSGEAAQKAPEATQEGGKQEEVTPEDKATAAKLSERIEQNRQEAVSPNDMTRRVDDQPDSIIFHTERIHVALPRDIGADEVKEMALQLLAFAAQLDTAASTKKQTSRKSESRQTTH